MAETADSPVGQFDFWHHAQRLGFVMSAGEARSAAESAGKSAEQWSLQKGLLSPAQMDVVTTLLDPNGTVPGYEILDFVGMGGMGVVYRARQNSLGRIVAIKTLLINQLGGAAAVARFENEAHTIGGLVHPHIVMAHDFGRHEGRLFLAMEYVEGVDGERLIRDKGPRPEIATWGLIRQVATGLAFASTMGVIHRDIKPGNLLIVPPPPGIPFPPGVDMVKIADFGLASLIDSSDETTRITSQQSGLGSPFYMAPEQVQSPSVDERADIYALGATAYHFLAGVPPFQGQSAAQIVYAKEKGPLPLREIRPGLKEETYQLVELMMAVKPGNRPQNYQSLLEQLDRWANTNCCVEITKTTSALALANRSSASRGDSVASRLMPLGMFLLAAAIIGASLLLVHRVSELFSYFKQTQEPPRLGPLLVATNHFVDLFDGQDLVRWRNQTGLWQIDTDEEGAPVITGKNGSIARPIFNPPHEPFQYYAVEMLCQLSSEAVVEFQFGVIPAKTKGEEERYVIRIENGLAEVGKRMGEEKTLRHLTKPVAGIKSPAEIRIERQPGEWRLSVNGKFLGLLRSSSIRELPELRLKVQGESASFSDIRVTELAEQAPVKEGDFPPK